MKCNTYIIFSDIAIKNKFAFVDFDDYRDAEDAVYDLHRKEFLGEIVSISYLLAKYCVNPIHANKNNR